MLYVRVVPCKQDHGNGNGCRTACDKDVLLLQGWFEDVYFEFRGELAETVLLDRFGSKVIQAIPTERDSVAVQWMQLVRLQRCFR